MPSSLCRRAEQICLLLHKEVQSSLVSEYGKILKKATIENIRKALH